MELLFCAPLDTVPLPICLSLQDGVDTGHWDVHTHSHKDKHLPHWTQVLYKWYVYSCYSGPECQFPGWCVCSNWEVKFGEVLIRGGFGLKDKLTETLLLIDIISVLYSVEAFHVVTCVL